MRPRFATLVEMLERRAAADDEHAFLFLHDGERPGPRLTFPQLAAQARAIAAELLARKLSDQRILLMYPPGLEFVAAFFGCLYARAIAVPVYPPDPARLDRSLARVRAISRDADARLLLTTREVLALADHLPAASLDGLMMLASDTIDPDAASLWRRPAIASDTLAFLQYTSGSTAAPKGVRVGHDHLLHNQLQIEQAMRRSPGCVNVSWLPLFHDMGLIGNVLGPLYTGADCVLMSPLDFLIKPARWLRAISNYRAHTSGGPNFAYDLCTRKISDEQRVGLDLSGWEIAFNGAEPVRAETLERFADRFAACGFRSAAFFPCYGLAEATLLVTGPSEPAPPRILAVRGAALADGVAEPTEDSVDMRRLVSCGQPWGGQSLLIAAPNTGARCPDGTIGEIWVHGESVAGGYHGQPDASAEIFMVRFDGRDYLRTGDLGFIRDGELYVTGRLKDLLIIRGRNHYPQDIEATVERCEPRIRRGCVAAFAFTVDGEEQAAVVAEVDARAAPVDAAALADLRGAVARDHGLRLAAIVLIRAGTILKTSSGKIQRHACREAFLRGSLEVVVHDATAPEERPRSPREATVLAQVLATTRRVLGMPALAIGPDEPLARLGLDSLVVVEWRIELERALAVAVPPLTETTTLAGLVRALAGATANEVRTGADDPWAELVNPPVARRLQAFRLDRRYVHGEGCWLWDDEGRRCLDFTAAYGALPFGFNPPEIWEALRDVARDGAPSLVQPSRLDAAGRLARRLVAVAPPGLCRVTFANSGAEAIEAAIKLVRAATGRLGIVVAERGFHGKTLGALSATARVSLQRPFGAPAPGFVRVPHGDLAALAELLAARADELAAVLLEPIQGEGGIFESPPGYLRGVRELCDRHGVLLVLDEVQTGLGRTGRLFACEHDGVVPDVLALAKALGGGLVPAAAVLATAACFSEAFALRHTSTFAGNALAAYAGLRTLELLTRDDQALVRDVAALGSVLHTGLTALQQRHPALITGVRGRGFMLGLELTADPAAFGRQGVLASMAAQETLGILLCSHLLHAEGVRLAPTLIGSRVLRVEPPLTATRAMIDELLAALARTFARLAACDSEALLGHLAGRTTTKPLAPTPTLRRSVARPRAGDGRWGFVFHPLAARSYIDFDAGLAGLGDDEILTLVASLHAAPPLDTPAALLVGAGRVESSLSAAFGEVAAVPATAEELLAFPAAEAISRVREAVELVRDRGARIVGLGAYTSIVTGGGLHLADTGVAITTGNSLTVVAATELVLQATRALGVPLAQRTVAVVGATGSIGRAVAIELAPHVGGLLLVGNPAHPQAAAARLRRVRIDIVRHLATLSTREELRGGLAEATAQLLHGLRGHVPPGSSHAPSGPGLHDAQLATTAGRLAELGALTGSTEIGAGLRTAAVVVAATSSPHALLTAEHLGPGAIVCDVSQPANVGPAVAAARPDVCILDGGVVTLPGGRDLGIGFGLAPGLAYACIAETILLALDHRERDASTGVDLSHAFIAELRTLAARHDFRVTPTRAGRPLVLHTP